MYWPSVVVYTADINIQLRRSAVHVDFVGAHEMPSSLSNSYYKQDYLLYFKMLNIFGCKTLLHQHLSHLSSNSCELDQM